MTEPARNGLLQSLAASPIAHDTSDLPPYVEQFCDALRQLVGIPFRYLVADATLLPAESVRFFFLDAAWIQATVAGALEAGAVGTRELQQAGLAAQTMSDTTEPPTSGMLVRSTAVSGWPAMTVRALDSVLAPNPTQAEIDAHQLPTLRLQRLAPTVLLALWRGVPASVWLEEPHHALQLGGGMRSDTQLVIERRAHDGTVLAPGDPNNELTVPMRAARMLDVRTLRRTLHLDAASRPEMPAQTGAAALALQLLSPPWRQRFERDGA